MGVLILALIAAAITLVIVSRKEKELEAEEEAEAEDRLSRSEEASRVFKAAPAAVKADAPAEEKPAEPTNAAPAAENETRGAHEAPAEPEGGEAADPDSFVLDGWYCVKCGSFNRGHNCSACGEEKPKDAIQYVCDKCGWTNPDPAHPPRFCPDCGAPFAAADKH